MNTKQKGLAVVGAVAAASALAGGAIAATGDEGRRAESAILSDAAKRLNVTPEQLRDALGSAVHAELDRAVKAGRLTQEQADAIKERRRRSGTVLGIGPRGGPGAGPRGFGPGGPGGPGWARRGGMVDDLADALGITERRLIQRLRAGDSIEDIAKDQGKTLDDVKKAVRDAAAERLDKAVADGDLTRAQADRILEHIDEHVDRLGDEPLFRRGGRRGGPPWGGPPAGDPPGEQRGDPS